MNKYFFLHENVDSTDENASKKWLRCLQKKLLKIPYFLERKLLIFSPMKIRSERAVPLSAHARSKIPLKSIGIMPFEFS